MAAHPSSFVSEAEYLRLDSDAEMPSEYLNGRMVEIEAATPNHSIITANVTVAITNAVRRGKQKCVSYSQSIRVHMPRTGLYAHPDFLLTCSEPVFQAYDTLMNPMLIVEVLSPTTEGYDRGAKFESYRSIRSLREYWTVAQDRVHVEQWSILEGRWTLAEYDSADAVIKNSIVEVPLTEVYSNITF